jgi:hypothetical protein
MAKTNDLINKITKNMSIPNVGKLYLNIEIKYQQDAINDSRKSFVELKIGEDKLYVVKNMKFQLLKMEVEKHYKN